MLLTPAIGAKSGALLHAPKAHVILAAKPVPGP
jgi:hypothetical protein